YRHDLRTKGKLLSVQNALQGEGLPLYDVYLLIRKFTGYIGKPTGRRGHQVTWHGHSEDGLGGYFVLVHAPSCYGIVATGRHKAIPIKGNNRYDGAIVTSDAGRHGRSFEVPDYDLALTIPRYENGAAVSMQHPNRRPVSAKVTNFLLLLDIEKS